MTLESRPTLAADEQELWDRTVAFATNHLVPSDMRERDRDGTFWGEGWRRCAGS